MPNSVECKNTSDGLYGYIAGLLEDQPFFRDLVGWLKAGNIEISMFRRLVNKKIEEEWIDAIEACIIPLDNVIRRPSRYIEELDEVKPIELSRNITSRSIQHLAQHTDYISEVKGDEVTPSKILNVYREETMLTYENRFVNTLIRQLYLFVGKRYKEMIKEGAENSTSFDISADFKDGNLTSNIRFGMTVSESAEGAAENDPLLRRVMRLNSVVTMYYNSPFAKEMAGAYVRPPIMRTNALMKNRNLRQCLELWQFIESYEKVGYTISVEQRAEKPDRALIERLYADLALQYTVFRKEIAKAADTLAEDPGAPFQPLFVEEIQPVEQKKFNLADCVYRKVTPVSYVNPPRKLSRDELKIRAAVDEALGVDAAIRKRDRIEETRRRVAEEARRRGAEKAREEARRRAEEDARAVAEYYASLGYRVRMKSRAAEGGEVVVEPAAERALSAAEAVAERVSALGNAAAEGTENAEAAEIASLSALSESGLALSDEEIAARNAAGDMPLLSEVLGPSWLRPESERVGGRGKVALGRPVSAGKGFVIAHMVPAFGAVEEIKEAEDAGEIAAFEPVEPVEEVESVEAIEEVPEVEEVPSVEPIEEAEETAAPEEVEEIMPETVEKVEEMPETPEEIMPEAVGEEEFDDTGADIFEETEDVVLSELFPMEETAEPEEVTKPEETTESEEVTKPEETTESEEATKSEETTEPEEAAESEEVTEPETFDDEAGLTAEEKQLYEEAAGVSGGRSVSRAKRRVLKKIDDTRRRKAELRQKNERRAAAAMEKKAKADESALSHRRYTEEARRNGNAETPARPGKHNGRGRRK